MLNGTGLSFRYDARTPWIFRDLEISVEPGEIMGLRGPSGHGKTTLARVLAGYEPPQEGEVRVDGERVADIKGYCPVQLVFQHPEKAVNPRWTMRKVLAESGHTQQETVEQLGIEPEWLTRFPNEISGGELQRFCVARALTDETRYLIADEMTTMLDALTQAQIWSVVAGWARARNAGVLIVSHDDVLLKSLCDRITDLGA